MGYILALGRDLTDDGRECGEQVKLILHRAIELHRKTCYDIVVAACRSPDFPEMEQTYAHIMAQWLYDNGVAREDVVVLEAETFNTRGELKAFYAFTLEQDDKGLRVVGFNWHMPRIEVIAKQIDPVWAKLIVWEPVVSVQPLFDQAMEPIKRLKEHLPESYQTRAVELWKRYISKRTSY